MRASKSLERLRKRQSAKLIRRALSSLLTAILVGASSNAIASEPPALPPADAPSGFAWYVFEAGDSACLRPLDWFVKTEVKGDTAALFVSKQDIDKEGKFDTGLTLNVLRGIRRKTGKAPSEYARAYLDELLAKHVQAKRFENAPQDGMPGIGAAYVDSESSPPVVIYTFLLADDEYDILRLFILEAPQEDWAAVWARGQQMLDCRIRR
jgi:hypothetical protein